MNDENMRAFVSYGNGISIELKQFITNTILIIIFGCPIIVLSELFLKICTIVIIITYIIVSIYCIKNKKQEKMIFLFLGNFSLAFSLILFFEALGILFFIVPEKNRLILILSLIFLYIFIGFIYLYYIHYLIRKGAYKDGSKTFKANNVLFAMSGILGMTIARQFLTGMEQSKVILIIMGCFFLLSILVLLGVPNLLKYYYMEKYNEILSSDSKKPL